MRDIVSPLAGFSSPFGRGADPYAILGYKPPLVLDYENSKFRVSGSTSTAPSVVTATRTGLATQLDASGNLVWNAHNLITYSEDFTDASWTKVSTTVTADATTSPDGILGASKLISGSGVSGYLGRSVTFVSGQVYAQSVYAKAAEFDFLYLYLSDGTDVPRAWFNLSNGTVGTEISSPNAQIEDVGNGWYRCSIYQTAATSGTFANALRFHAVNADNETTVGDGTSGVFIWGAHLYRSDLGGMAPVPLTRRVAGSTTYVPTTSAAVYLPREEAYTYVSGSLVGPYYQKESDARTNLVTYSEDFTNASWLKVGATITANNTTSPDGTTTADKASTTAGSDALYQLTTVTSGATAAASTYLKFDDCDWIALRLINNGTPTSQVRVWLNLSTGTIGTSSATGAGATLLSASVEDVGGGWYRLAVVGSHAGVSTYRFQITTADGDASDTRAATGASYFIWGAQLEEGSTPTSYIPTAGSTVTRSADSTTISAGNMPAYTNALSFQMEGLMTYAQSQLIAEVEFIRWQADINNRIPVVLDTRSPTTGTVRFGQVASGVADIVVSAISTYSPGINVPFNISSRHGSTFINGAVDGTALTANTTPTALPDLSATTFDLAPTFNGFIKEFRVWADDIGDSGIAEAST